MCDPSGGVLTMMGLQGAGATMAGIGLAAGTAGALYSGYSQYQAAKVNAKLIDQQRENEAKLASIKDQRERSKFQTAIRQQFAELASRGVALDSPTALLLGENAAQEMSFQSQATRQSAAARDAELSASAQMMRARGRQALFGGVLSAAGTFLTGAPDVWPELLA